LQRRNAVNIQRRRFLGLAVGVTALPATTRVARAQAYPARSVRILVATTAGGATDLAARLVAQWLTDKLGQSFFVENRPGGQHHTHPRAPPALAPPDASPFSVANPITTSNPPLNKNPTNTFIPASARGMRSPPPPLLLMVHPSVPATTVPELIAYAKANPEKL